MRPPSLPRRALLAGLAALAPAGGGVARAQGPAAPPPRPAPGAAVDLALVLAVDVSASVDHEEFALTMGGYAAAFRNPSVVAAASRGPRGAVAVTMLLWSGPGSATEAVAWARLDGAASAEAFAAAIDAAPRSLMPGATSLGTALRASMAALGRCPFPPARMVIDVSGDGPANAGPPLAPARELAGAGGITVNGLAVVNEEPELAEYYQRELIIGPGAFVIEAPDYDAFAESILRKLLREMGERLII